jgi:hypothetical protein
MIGYVYKLNTTTISGSPYFYNHISSNETPADMTTMVMKQLHHPFAAIIKLVPGIIPYQRNLSMHQQYIVTG